MSYSIIEVKQYDDDSILCISKKFGMYIARISKTKKIQQRLNISGSVNYPPTLKRWDGL